MAKKKIDEVFEEDRPKKQRAMRVKYFKTGCTLLDTVVGGGSGSGFPAGTIANLYGESGAGKTFFACELIAAAAHQYKEKCKWVYDDVEHGLSFDGRKLWGIDIIPEKEEDQVRSDTIEDLYYNIRKFLKGLKDDEVGIYVVDSLDALSNTEMEEEGEDRMKAGDKGEEYDKGSYNMSTQKFLSQTFFRTITAELDDKNVLLVFISQLRDNVNAGLYGKKRRKSGGSALEYYCTNIIELRTKEKFQKKGRDVGVCVEAKADKSRTARPFRSTYVNILFDYGIDDISSNIDFLYDLKSPKTGQLLGETALSSINIGDTTDPLYGKYGTDLDGVKQFMSDNGMYDLCVAELKAQDKKKTKGNYIEWIKADPERKALYEKCYGIPMTRDELIEMADKDRDLRRRIKLQAVDKWEDIEASIVSGRTKYKDDEEDY